MNVILHVSIAEIGAHISESICFHITPFRVVSASVQVHRARWNVILIN